MDVISRRQLSANQCLIVWRGCIQNQQLEEICDRRQTKNNIDIAKWCKCQCSTDIETRGLVRCCFLITVPNCSCDQSTFEGQLETNTPIKEASETDSDR